jgi:hypothetical protein
MNERSSGLRRVNTVLTVVVCAAVVAIPCWADRAFRRWWDSNRPLAPLGTRMRRMQTQYRARQDSVEEATEVVAAVADLIAVALSASRPPAGSSGRA